MTWLGQIEKETLETLIREGECMHLSTDLDGKIFGASDSFCEWSGYSLWELQNTMTWIRLSKDDANLKADLQAADEIRKGQRTEYQIEKQYVTKSGTAHWGLLHVRRWPATGDVAFCWCSWTPFKNGNATAFEEAKKTSIRLEKRLDEMTAELRSINHRTDEENWIISSVRMAMRHPRIAVAIVIAAASLLGLDSVLSIMRGIGFLPTPVQVEKVDYDLFFPKASINARGIAYERPEAEKERPGETVRIITSSGRSYDLASTVSGRLCCGVGESTGGRRKAGSSTRFSGSREQAVLGLRGVTDITVRKF